MARATQHVDHHTTIDHAQPRCSSRELYKGVLGGRATAVFNGKVFVRPDAQQSDARQMNKNLLLSENAVINTKPQLEIFADDVKCTHGATIGRLDEDALFYLRSRGIDTATAREVLIYAFANELVTHVPSVAIREQLDAALRQRLGQSGADREDA
jgi:Fe-S cluster assembly protein SufD